MTTADITDLMPLPDYRVAREHLFPSQASLDWFLRKNKEALVSEGALLLLTGRWFAAPREFDRFMAELGTRNAYARC